MLHSFCCNLCAHAGLRGVNVMDDAGKSKARRSSNFVDSSWLCSITCDDGIGDFMDTAEVVHFVITCVQLLSTLCTN